MVSTLIVMLKREESQHKAFVLALLSAPRSLCFALSLLSPLLALLESLAKAERLTKKFEDMRAVSQSVQECRRKMFLPITEFQSPNLRLEVMMMALRS